MMKKILSILLIFVLLFTLIPVSLGNSTANAEESETRTEEELRNDLNNLANDITILQGEKAEIQKQADAIANAIEELRVQIEELEAEIEEINEKILKKEEEIEQKLNEIDIQEKNLNARLRAMYKNGTVSFMDVLLGSHSISELVYNIKMVRMIHEYDVEVVEILQKEHEELEQMKLELEEAKEELDLKKAELASQVAEKQAKKSELNAKISQIDEEIAAKKDEVNNLTVEINGYVGGDFVWPLPSYTRNRWYITSWVGWRLHPIYNTWRYHGGTDIAAGTGTSIYACGNGTVIKSSNYSNYGLTVMIDHGDGVVSLYGHCSQLIARVGQFVVAGDVIAKVGMTGAATGPHLHFEVMINGNEQDSMKYFPDIEAYRPSDVIL